MQLICLYSAFIRLLCEPHHRRIRPIMVLLFLLQVVMEYDGVVVEDTSDLQSRAWQKTAEQEGRRIPLQFQLQRAEGMKNDQVCQSPP